MKSNILANCLVGFAVGIAGGIIGLGGAELRLPYLVGALRLTAHQAVPVNLAVSLFTIAAAIPARFATLRFENIASFALETAAIAVGAVIAAYLGVGWLRRLSPQALSRTIFVLLVILGVGMIAESFVEIAPLGLLPLDIWARLIAGLLFGFLIGVESLRTYIMHFNSLSLFAVKYASARGSHSNSPVRLGASLNPFRVAACQNGGHLCVCTA
jgi:hypothetical protein